MVFDVAIIGGGTSQAVLALELARKGFKVCLVEGRHRASELSSSLAFSRQLLGNGWSTLVPGRILPLSCPDIVEDVVTEGTALVVLDLNQEKRFLFSPQKTAVHCESTSQLSQSQAREYIQFLDGLENAPELRNSWLHTFMQSSLVSAKMKRQWEDEAKKLGSRVPAFSKWSTSVLDQDSPELLSSFIGSLAFGLAPVSPRSLTWDVAMKAVGLAAGGLTTLKESQADWSIQLRARLRQVGVLLLENVGVQSLVTGRSFSGRPAIEGVLLDSHHGVQFARNIVLGSNQSYLYQTLRPEIRRPETYERFNFVTPTHVRLGVKVFVKRKLPALFENFTIIRKQGLLRTDFPEVILQKCSDRSFLLQILHPLTSARLEWPWVRRGFGLGFQEFFQLFPFLEDEIEYISPDLRDSAVAKDIQENLAPLCLGTDQANLSFYVRGGKEHQDVQGLPWSTGHENLFFAGPRIWPALGFYGELLVNSLILREISERNRVGLRPTESSL